MPYSMLDLISRTHFTMFTSILLIAPFQLPRSCFTTCHDLLWQCWWAYRGPLKKTEKLIKFWLLSSGSVLHPRGSTGDSMNPDCVWLQIIIVLWAFLFRKLQYVLNIRSHEIFWVKDHFLINVLILYNALLLGTTISSSKNISVLKNYCFFSMEISWYPTMVTVKCGVFRKRASQ